MESSPAQQGAAAVQYLGEWMSLMENDAVFLNIVELVESNIGNPQVMVGL